MKEIKEISNVKNEIKWQTSVSFIFSYKKNKEGKKEAVA